MFLSGTIVPSNGTRIRGLAPANRSQTTQFYDVNIIGSIFGIAYPMFYTTAGLAGSNSSYETMLVVGSQTYQTLFLQDSVKDGSGVTSLRFQDVHLNSNGNNTAYVLRGGFGYWWERGGWGNGPSSFNGLPAVLLTQNCGTVGVTGRTMPATLFGNHTYLFGGGMVVETCGQGPTGGYSGNATLYDMLVEGSYVPMVKVNTISAFQLNTFNAVYADLRSGAATPMFDWTNGSSIASVIEETGCATGFTTLFEVSTALAYSGLIARANACPYLGTQMALNENVTQNTVEYRNWSLKLTGSGPGAGRLYLGSIPSPAAPQNAVTGGAGSVPAGNQSYAFTAVDADGHETLTGPVFLYNAPDSAHSAVVTAPATFPAGAVGVNLYRNGNKANAGTCGNPQLTTPGATLTDATSFGCGPTQPTSNTTGLYSVSQNGFNSPTYRMGLESFSSVPRAVENVFLPGALTTTWTGSSWTPDKAITVTRVMVQAKTAPVTCTPNAIVRVTDGSTPVNVTVSAASNDSGAIAVNYAAGALVTTGVQTAAAGCGTSPADANVTIQYRMQ